MNTGTTGGNPSLVSNQLDNCYYTGSTPTWKCGVTEAEELARQSRINGSNKLSIAKMCHPSLSIMFSVQQDPGMLSRYHRDEHTLRRFQATPKQRGMNENRKILCK
ncbi:hypothetical protein M407DRAFT_102185 [Tulasnella calospora MUT 4182]|uniref:Uncharacterized protein n=1 Tax=Tulasnella calospora MUT 4182 TaxID=1051891 RepID=A0A0C3LSK3_9AGAM|nr:hypothetical protein M407DRAFT_102185 [Tulasnella calospora MUT 4182]